MRVSSGVDEGRSRNTLRGSWVATLEGGGLMADVPAPRITVIVPTFNRAAYLAAAIASVLGQTAPIHDILIVDDGSTDGTRDVVSAYFPRVRYLHQPNGGKIAAIERGLGETSGDLVWIMDDDDIACPNALAALAAPLLREPHLVFSYGHLVQFTTQPDGTMVEGARSHYPTDDPRPFLLKFMEDGFITGQPCVLARRTALEAIFPFDHTITASVDYCLNLDMGLLGPAAFVDETVLLQRQHAGARGPLANRYEESERADRWKRSDQILIGRLLAKMPLDAFVPHRIESRIPTSRAAAAAEHEDRHSSEGSRAVPSSLFCLASVDEPSRGDARDAGSGRSPSAPVFKATGFLEAVQAA